MTKESEVRIHQADSVPADSNEKVTMAAEFTPGPWRLYPGDNYYIEASTYPEKFPHKFPGDDTGDFLAYVGNRTLDFGKANGRLIAAAPDLYAALELARAYIETCADACEEATADLDIIDVALAKARGGQVNFSDESESEKRD